MIKELALGIAIAWVFGKLVKAIIDWTDDKKISYKTLFSDGGMPSLHTIAVASLATGIYLEEQGISALFILSVVLALIVINDALKVRWVTGEQSKAINQLMKENKEFQQHKPFEERVGHKPIEVLVGLIIGVAVPVLVYALI